MIREVHLTSKEHHAGEDGCALFAHHEFVALFAANQRSGMEAEVRKSHAKPICIKTRDEIADVKVLIVQHQPDAGGVLTHYQHFKRKD